MANDRAATDWPHSGSTSSSLLERVKAQDPEAWQQLVKLYGPLIYRWCRRSGLQGSDAADIAQDTFAAVASGIAGFQRETPGGSFRGWLRTIVQHKVCDHFRRRKGQAQGEGGTAANERMAQLADASEPSTTQEPCLAAMPWSIGPSNWSAPVSRSGPGKPSWRVAVEGQPAAAVAQELGMGVQAVYDAGYRIRRRIRTELAGLIDPP